MIALLLPLLLQAERPLDRLLAPLRGEREPPGRNARADAERVVDDGLPRFDADGDGRVGPLEFERWMAALAPGARPGATADRAWAERAFAQADEDASGALSRGELARFLAETVSWRLRPAPSD